jgi:hypothetical protein
MSGSNGTAETATEIEIADYEHRVTEGLRRIYKRTRFEPSEEKTPCDAIMANEEAPHCPHCKEAIEMPHELEEWGIRNETVRRMFQLFCQSGLEPWNVMREVFAIATHMGLEPWSKLTLREKSLMLGDSHGSQHWRIEKIVNLLRRKGARSYKAPGQKSLASRGNYSVAQEGNTNRKRQHRPRHRRLKAAKQKQKKL